MSKPKTRRELETSLIVKAIKDPEFKKSLLSNPREGVVAAVKELDPNFEIRDDMNIQVYEEPENSFYLVLPHIPAQQVEISDEDLEKVAGGIFTDQWGDATVIVGF